jgi:hypothetical protein
MRLRRIVAGRTVKAKLIFAVMRVLSGQRAPDVIRVLIHRPELFSGHFNRLLQASLRGDSEWSVGEREAFASFTSSLNQCVF